MVFISINRLNHISCSIITVFTFLNKKNMVYENLPNGVLFIIFIYGGNIFFIKDVFPLQLGNVTPSVGSHSMNSKPKEAKRVMNVSGSQALI